MSVTDIILAVALAIMFFINLVVLSKAVVILDAMQRASGRIVELLFHTLHLEEKLREEARILDVCRISLYRRENRLMQVAQRHGIDLSEELESDTDEGVTIQ